MKNKRDLSNFGFSTLMLGFAMMCIVTFSALTLLTANSDYRLSQKVADKNTTYYQIEKEAYLLIADIDANLQKQYISSSQEDVYLQSCFNTLSSQYDGDTYIEDDKLFYHFSKVISDSQTLEVTLQILYPVDMSKGFYTIRQWQNVTDTDIITDDTLNLIGTN